MFHINKTKQDFGLEKSQARQQSEVEVTNHEGGFSGY